jgi:anti-anti-sigma factor
VTAFAGFENRQGGLAVQGEVDLLSAPELGVFFDAATASGYPSVVLDLTGMVSIDAAGLTVIGSAVSGLVGSGRQLTFRSSLSEIARVLDTSWLAKLISLEPPGLSPKRLESEQSTPDGATSLLTERDDISEKEAFDIMRLSSRWSDNLRDAAKEVVDSPGGLSRACQKVVSGDGARPESPQL